MALSNAITEAAGNVPIFLPGMVALNVLEQLWAQGFIKSNG
jgi:hypothetical protein